ncbi:hypothetical protein HRG_012044 [Hirsutella rhossiliensis]
MPLRRNEIQRENCAHYYFQLISVSAALPPHLAKMTWQWTLYVMEYCTYSHASERESKEQAMCIYMFTAAKVPAHNPDRQKVCISVDTTCGNISGEPIPSNFVNRTRDNMPKKTTILYELISHCLSCSTRQSLALIQLTHLEADWTLSGDLPLDFPDQAAEFFDEDQFEHGEGHDFFLTQSGCTYNDPGADRRFKPDWAMVSRGRTWSYQDGSYHYLNLLPGDTKLSNKPISIPSSKRSGKIQYGKFCSIAAGTNVVMAISSPMPNFIQAQASPLADHGANTTMSQLSSSMRDISLTSGSSYRPTAAAEDGYIGKMSVQLALFYLAWMAGTGHFHITLPVSRRKNREISSALIRQVPEVLVGSSRRLVSISRSIKDAFTTTTYVAKGSQDVLIRDEDRDAYGYFDGSGRRKTQHSRGLKECPERTLFESQAWPLAMLLPQATAASRCPLRLGTFNILSMPA